MLAAAAQTEGTRAVRPTSLPFDGADHVYHLFVVRSELRDELRDHLAARDIASAVHYPEPIHLTDAYAPLGLTEGALPECERLSRRICSLPLFPGMSDTELERVAEAVLGFTQEPGASRVDQADGRFVEELERVTVGQHAGADGAVNSSPAQGREHDRG